MLRVLKKMKISNLKRMGVIRKLKRNRITANARKIFLVSLERYDLEITEGNIECNVQYECLAMSYSFNFVEINVDNYRQVSYKRLSSTSTGFLIQTKRQKHNDRLSGFSFPFYSNPLRW